jgi:8-oxo-dGTP diphosphatase
VKAIRAAGGIVWRKTPEGRKLAVVHRARYNDWCLPKGKLNEGESWEAAALREVREETGCAARITGRAGSVSYQVQGRPKKVRFYTMEAVGHSFFVPSEEVEEVVWLTPEEALHILDYPAERDVLSSLLAALTPPAC